MFAHVPAMMLIFGATLAVSLLLTPLVRWAALRRGLVDAPGEPRRVHTRPVPRLGGLAMFAAFAVGVALMFALDIYRIQGPLTYNSVFEPVRVLFVLAGAGVITAVMAVDDIRGLPPLPRLVVQVGAALLVVLPSLIWPGGPNPLPDGTGMESAGTLHFDQGAGVIATSVRNPFGGTIELPLALAVVLSVVWIVGMTNTINWLDGLDGLAAGVSAISCGVLFVIMCMLQQYTLAYLPLVLGAATLGFLPFNIHPARIFMGDSGAMFLGFTLGIISIIGGAKVAAALLLLGIPILDGVYIVFYRLYHGRSPMSADRGHLHHRLLDIGFSQQQVVMVFYLLCGTFGLLALLLTGHHGTIVLFGLALSFSLFKLFVLVLMAGVLFALTTYVARRRFDRVGSGG